MKINEGSSSLSTVKKFLHYCNPIFLVVVFVEDYKLDVYMWANAGKLIKSEQLYKSAILYNPFIRLYEVLFKI